MASYSLTIITFEIGVYVYSICHCFIFTGVFTAAFDCQIELLIVKGIADHADDLQLAPESWSSCASVMAASLVSHILNEPCVFHSWPHYQGILLKHFTRGLLLYGSTNVWMPRLKSKSFGWVANHNQPQH